jgi:tetratricopeptide (TPR) repeat protein
MWPISVYAGAESVTCPDGEKRLTLDIKELAIQYEGHSWSGTLSSLSVLGMQLERTPTQLQEAAAATQQWNEFLKGLAVGYNTCVISQEQYAEGLTRIYPRLQEDAADLEKIRELLSKRQKIDESRLQRLLDSYFGNLERFAKISQKEIIIERITAVVQSSQQELTKKFEEGTASLQEGQLRLQETITKKFDAIAQLLKQSPIAKPEEVKTKIAQRLEAKAKEAEAAYDQGYALYQRYRFTEAIPYLKKAAAISPLPEFYAAVGDAWYLLSNLTEAMEAYQQGLKEATQEKNQEQLAALNNQLGLVLKAQGDLPGALEYAKRALAIDEVVFGPEHPNVARDLNNIGQILKAQGDLVGALEYAKRALAIDEVVFGPEHPKVAIRLNNIGTILYAQGDLVGALDYSQRSLKIFRSVYGPDHSYSKSVSQNLEYIQSELQHSDEK